MSYMTPNAIDETLAAVMDDVEIPLKNVEYTIQQYLLAHGARLDTETRILLAGVRDCVGRVAGSTRELARRDPQGPECAQMVFAAHVA